jgi:hypothetical protein
MLNTTFDVTQRDNKEKNKHNQQGSKMECLNNEIAKKMKQRNTQMIKKNEIKK